MRTGNSVVNEFVLEKKLKDRSADLHRRMRDCVAVLQNTLQLSTARFPTFTDHSTLHSMNVLDFCNRLIGEERVKELSPEECYVIIMACYLHDVGMGISDRDYGRFLEERNSGDTCDASADKDVTAAVRAAHHELSAWFIRRYADLLDIPSEEPAFAIAQVSKGHRKTDLLDEKQYPDMVTENGATVRTAYLSAVLRLADEIDVARDRNPELLFDVSQYTEKKDIEAFGTHAAIRMVEIKEKSILLYTDPEQPEYIRLIREAAEKIRETLDYCRIAAAARSGLGITQERVEILPWNGTDGVTDEIRS